MAHRRRISRWAISQRSLMAYPRIHSEFGKFEGGEPDVQKELRIATLQF
jgi:hypothetical protein